MTDTAKSAVASAPANPPSPHRSCSMSYDDETRTHSTGSFGQASPYSPHPAYPVNPASPGPQVPPRNLTRYAQWAIAAAGLLAAALFLLLPLPTLDVLGSPVGFCGPGLVSDNAAQVLIDPTVVTDDTDTSSVDSGSALRTYCLGKAKERGYYALATGGGGLVVALGIAYAQASPRRRVGTW
jgi:hypothetical protein